MEGGIREREREGGKRNEEEEEEEKLKEKKMTKKEEEDGGGRNEEDEEEGGAARDLEMRDVRRDGLIEAFLIAFTPLHGLLYPRYIQYQSYVADPHHIRPWLLLLPPPFLSLSLSLLLLLLSPSPLCSIFSICFSLLYTLFHPPRSSPTPFYFHRRSSFTGSRSKHNNKCVHTVHTLCKVSR